MNRMTLRSILPAIAVAAIALAGMFGLGAGDASASRGNLADWQANYGVGASAHSSADVDGRDFLVWQRGYGQ
jgi:hypothetical protein